MNPLSGITRVRVLEWASAGFFALAVTAPAFAQTMGTDPADAQGNWHSKVNGVSQSAHVATSNDGVGIAISISGQDHGSDWSAGHPGAAIQEQPKGPQHFSGPGISVPGWSSPGRSPDPILPLDGSNIIVAGGPTSAETSPGQPPTTFGGFSIGGWTFDT